MYAPFNGSILIFLSGLGEIRQLNDLLMDTKHFSSHNFWILPLHSSISTEDQSRVFEIPPPGVRKIVLSTNIAETGVTIPDCTIVIDAGRHREMRSVKGIILPQ